MTDEPDEPIITEPLEPKSVNGEVHAVDPPVAKLRMTPDAAEITSIRLLDAADRARRRE
jgi:hypothetical protein